MIRVVLRLIGLVVTAGAFVAVVVDGARSIVANAIVVTSFEHLVGHADPGFHGRLRALLDIPAWRWLWDPVAIWVISCPAFIVLAAFGLALLLVARPNSGPETI